MSLTFCGSSMFGGSSLSLVSVVTNETTRELSMGPRGRGGINNEEPGVDASMAL